MDDTGSFDIGALAASLRRRLPVIALATLVVATATLAFSLAQPEKYTAEASLLFRDPGFDERLFGTAVFSSTDPDREAATNVALVSLDVVADRTAEDLEASISGDDVSEMVEVQVQGQADLASVAATSSDPRFAAELANSFSSNYIDFRREADRAKIDEAQGLIQQDLPKAASTAARRSLQNQLSQLRTLEALQTGNAELVQTADVPTSPSSPKVLRNTLVGGFLGLLFGLASALLLERVDRRHRGVDELEESYGWPILAHVPLADDLSPRAGLSQLDSGEDEAFRMLRTRLRYFNVDREIQSLVVTSALPGEGKSTVAWHMARTSAASGTRTILLEADFRQSVVAERTGLAPLPGLSEVLTHQGTLPDSTQSVEVQGAAGGSEARSLDVLVAGAAPPNPTDLLESEEFTSLLEKLNAEYRLIVIDTPPATVVADAIPVLGRVDGVIVVGRLGQTTHDAASHLRGQLEQLTAPILGVVVNGVKPGRGYQQHYGGDYRPSGSGIPT